MKTDLFNHRHCKALKGNIFQYPSKALHSKYNQAFYNSSFLKNINTTFLLQWYVRAVRNKE